MTQLTINIENQAILPHLRKILNSIEGVTVVNRRSISKKNGLDKALEDVKLGNVTKFDSIDDFFNDLEI